MKKKLTILTIALITVMAMSVAAYANSYTAEGGTYTFDGSSIATDTGKTLSDAISGLEPGDDITVEITYKNGDSGNTEWYMKNDVIKSLEDGGSSAENGGYTYVLENVGPDGTVTTIFSNDSVGGESTNGGTGLHQATNATGDWFYIQTLGAGQSGTTRLYVALEGEAEANAYADTEAELTVAYAVEKEDEGDTIYEKTSSSGVKTGDDTNLLLPLVIFLAALLLFILGMLSMRRDRKRGEDA